MRLKNLRGLLIPVLTFLCALLTGSVSAQSEKDRWIDSVFLSMDEAEKISQLFIVPLSSNWDRSKLNNIEQQVKSQGLGGLLFTTGHPLRQVSLTNDLQSQAKHKLLIAMDASSGLLDSALNFPNALSLATLDDTLLYQYGWETGRQLKMMGVNFNFAPGLNLATNTIGIPSTSTYGEDPLRVADRALAIYRGFSAHGILGAVKYFPVQGITVTEIKNDFPKARLFVDSTQATPFKILIDNDVRGIVTASSALPLFYETKNSAKKNRFTSSQLLSASLAGEWLERNFSFKGLLIVDIRPVMASAKKLKNGEAELFAFQSGNDMIITDDPQPALRRIKRLLKKEKEFKLNLEIAVRKILSAKYDAGLSRWTKIPSQNFMLKLRPPETRIIEQRLYRSALVVRTDTMRTLPVRSLENKKILSVVVGDSMKYNTLHHYLNKYTYVKRLNIKNDGELQRKSTAITDADLVIVSFTPEADEKTVQGISSLMKSRRSGQEWIASGIMSEAFQRKSGDFPSIVAAFNADEQTLIAIPQLIFGGIGAEGTMPLLYGADVAGSGQRITSLKRFEYSFPEDAGISSRGLEKISAIAEEAIRIGGTPGCHVLVAKEGKIVYEKSFGHLTYEKQIPVTDSTIYDLASITKVSATLQAVMFLYDRGLIDINKKASVYLPEMKNSNKEDITLKDVLTHQAGLWPFLPFWASTMKDSTHMPEFYAKKPALNYPYMVADNLYATVGMRDSLWNWIIKSKIREKPARTPFDYRYSDMGFYILQHLAERILNQPIDDFFAAELI